MNISWGQSFSLGRGENSGDGWWHSNVCVCLMLLSCASKNGQDGKFVICILPPLKTKQRLREEFFAQVPKIELIPLESVWERDSDQRFSKHHPGVG